MSRREVSLEEVLELLRALGLPAELATRRTARVVLALADSKPRGGLLPGHRSLSEGARVHDVLTYVREDLGTKVAENSRETYRKGSLRPLCDAGLVVRHQLATNDPNTYYRLTPKFTELLTAPPGEKRDRLLRALRLGGTKVFPRPNPGEEAVEVPLSGSKVFRLSPGLHNWLEKLAVETLGPTVLPSPQAVYIGDAASRKGFQDRRLMRSLNLPLDISASLPDVILFDGARREILLIEAVASTGAITEPRLAQLRELISGSLDLGITAAYYTIFPSRRIFQRFVQQIAWGTSVWIADEPTNVIHFVELVRSGQPALE